MRKHWLTSTLAAVFFIAFGFQQTSQAQALSSVGKLGVFGGVTFEQLDDIPLQGNAIELQNSTSIHFGASYDQPIGPVHVRPAFVARRLGTYAFPQQEDLGFLIEGRAFDVWSFEVPVDVRYQFDDVGDTVAPYIFAGPTIATYYAEEDFSQALNRVAWSGQIGVGAELDFAGLPLSISPEVQYSFGITDLVEEDFDFRFQSFSTDGLATSGFSLRVYVSYDLASLF